MLALVALPVLVKGWVPMRPAMRFPVRAVTTQLAVKAAPPDNEQGSKILPRSALRFVKSLGKGVFFVLPLKPNVSHALFGLRPARKNKTSRDENDAAKTVGFTLREGIRYISIYLMIGVLGYHWLLHENWSIMDAMYFAVTSFTSVGYGDLSPHTAASKIFTCVFSLGGIAFLAAALASIGSSLAEAELKTVQAAQKMRKARLFGGLDRLRRDKKRRANTQVTAVVPFRKPPATGEIAPEQPSVTTRQVVTKALRKLMAPTLFLWTGGLIMGKLEGFSVLDSVYFSMITASTIGLGDLCPTSKMGRMAALVFIPLAVASGGEILSIIASAFLERRRNQIFETYQKDFTMDHIKAMDNDGDGVVSQLEYTEFMLVEMKLLEKSILDELREQFSRLDMDMSGKLSKNDLILLAKQRREKVTIEINGEEGKTEDA